MESGGGEARRRLQQVKPSENEASSSGGRNKAASRFYVCKRLFCSVRSVKHGLSYRLDSHSNLNDMHSPSP